MSFLNKLALILVLGMVVLTPYAYSKGNLGFTYSQAVSDHSWGVLGDYEYNTHKRFGFDVEGQFQSGYLGDLDLGVTFKTSFPIDVRIYNSNKIKGHSLNSLGNESDIGLAGVIEIKSANVSIGIFGREGNPYGDITRRAILEGEGDSPPSDESFDEVVKKGINLQDGSSLNASIQTEFDWNRFEIEVKGLLALLAENDRLHQFIFDVSTDGNLSESITWQIGTDIEARLSSGKVEWETSWIATLGYSF